MFSRFLALVLLGCSGVVAHGAARNGDTAGAAAHLPAGVHVWRDLHYGNGARQTLDVYQPPHAAQAPVIVMVHGGAWRFGDKSMGRAVDSKVARWVPRGFVFVSIDYGLLPDTPVARQVDDVAQALAYVQKHAAAWGGDARKVLLMGHSAGAHLVAVLGAAPARATAAGAQPWLGTLVLDSAALDVARVMHRRHLPLYDAAFGSDAQLWKAVSPIDVLDESATPLLVVCSSVRSDDSCGEAQAFVARARSLGVHAAAQEEPLTHAQINFMLGTPGPYTDAVETFMKSLDPSLRRQLESTP